jgi:hypothetical protein
MKLNFSWRMIFLMCFWTWCGSIVEDICICFHQNIIWYLSVYLFLFLLLIYQVF